MKQNQTYLPFSEEDLSGEAGEAIDKYDLEQMDRERLSVSSIYLCSHLAPLVLYAIDG